MMKKVIVAAAIVIVAACAFLWWRKSPASMVEETAATSTSKVARGSIRQTVQCTGPIVSNLEVEIKCRASGEVIKLPFDISAPVKKGDLLLELDPVDQERQVQQAQATLAASEARLAQAENALIIAEKDLAVARQKAAALDSARARAADAKAKAKRQEELLDKKFSSPEESETARTAAVAAEQDLLVAEANLADIATQEQELETRRQDIKLYKAQLESNRIALALAQRQLGYTKVYAPIDGVVADRKVQIGQIISSGVTNIGGGTTVLLLSDVSKIFVLAAVDESNIGLVALDQPVEITVDAYPRMKFEGRVDRIGVKGLNTSNVVTFEVRVEVLSDKKNLLKLAMTANVTIVVADKSDVLMVPVTSIVREKADTFVQLAKGDGSAGEKRPVQTGISDGVNIEIVSGLQEGEEVVVLSPEAESRWRNDPQSDRRMRDRMMMRTVGGSAMRGRGR